MSEKIIKRYRRHKRVRSKVIGTAKVPRICVFRSSKHIYAQIIDDEKGRVILSASDSEVKKSNLKKSEIRSTKSETNSKFKIQKVKEKDKKEEKIKTRKVAVAYEVGKLLAEKALKDKIKKVVFDRGGYRYHGRVKAIAEGARDAGLLF
ncbi:hypothetical protein AMJ49_06575 [Parcubacteria bacterium DG_74_2]|nr:MAG: hypothetical protein AMJ49_06575 [Parcubacteria bacterium DG_74_2]